MNNEEKQNLTPAELANDIYRGLKEAREASLGMAEGLDHCLNIANVAREYWNEADPTSFHMNPAGGTAITGMKSFHSQVIEYRRSLEAVRLSAESIVSTAAFYGTLTATAFEIVSPTASFDPARIYAAIERHEQNEEYARKLERLDPELGRIYRQILQIQSRTTSYPEKSILPDIRQAFDCLISKLVPNRGLVRSQSWWPSWYPHPDDRNRITTPQLVRFAAETHVRNAALRATLVDDCIHILAVHKQLSELFHETSPVDIDKAQAAIQSMLAILNLWADALEL